MLHACLISANKIWPILEDRCRICLSLKKSNLSHFFGNSFKMLTTQGGHGLLAYGWNLRRVPTCMSCLKGTDNRHGFLKLKQTNVSIAEYFCGKFFSKKETWSHDVWISCYMGWDALFYSFSRIKTLFHTKWNVNGRLRWKRARGLLSPDFFSKNSF